MEQVRARGKSTNHEYIEREAARTCLVCLAATTRGILGDVCTDTRFFRLADSDYIFEL